MKAQRILFFALSLFLIYANATSLSATDSAPSVSIETAPFTTSPRCGSPATNVIHAAVEAMNFGLACFRTNEMSDRLNSLTHIAYPSDDAHKVRLDCEDPDHMSYRAYAHEGEHPQRVEFSSRMLASLSQPSENDKNKVTVFHEYVHLLNPNYTHDYHADIADVAIACEICCSHQQHLDNLNVGYIDRSAMTDADYAQQCNYCKTPEFSNHLTNTSLSGPAREQEIRNLSFNYRKRMYELTIEKNKPLMLDVMLLSMEGQPENIQREILTPEVRAQICNLDDVAQILPLIRPEILHDSSMASSFACGNTAAKPPSDDSANEGTSNSKNNPKAKEEAQKKADYY